MSVAAIGNAVPTRLGPSSPSNKPGDGRPNTGQTGMYNNLFRGMPGAQQKLPVSRIPDIVKRMQRDTKSSQAKRSGQWYKSDNYIDPRSYTWRNLELYTDYRAHMWTNDGNLKHTYKK